MTAKSVIAVDNDPQALIAARDNAARNGVEEIIQATAPGVFEATEADVVLANILAAPLVELAPVLTAMLRPGGALVLSGILVEQVDEVAQAYRPYTGALAVAEDRGWARLAGGKS